MRTLIFLLGIALCGTVVYAKVTKLTKTEKTTNVVGKYSCWTAYHSDELRKVEFDDSLLLQAISSEVIAVMKANDRKHKADIKNVFVIDYNGTDSILVVDNLGYSLGSDANTIDFAGYIDLGYYRIVLSNGICNRFCHQYSDEAISLKHTWRWDDNPLTAYDPLYWWIIKVNQNCYKVEGPTIESKDYMRYIYRH